MFFDEPYVLRTQVNFFDVLDIDISKLLAEHSAVCCADFRIKEDVQI